MNSTLSTQTARVIDRRAGQNTAATNTTKKAWPKLPVNTPHGHYCRRFGWTFYKNRAEALEKFKEFIDSPQPIVKHPIFFRGADGQTLPGKTALELAGELGLHDLHEIPLPALDAIMLLTDRDFFRRKLSDPKRLADFIDAVSKNSK